MQRYLTRERLPDERLRTALAARTGARMLHPVFFGSAMTGAGVDALVDRHLGPAAGERR